MQDYKLGIRDLQIPVRLGVHPHEQRTPQPIEIVLEMVIAPSGGQELGVSIPSYSVIRQALIEEAQREHVALLEELASRLLSVCLKQKGVVSAKLQVAKLEALSDGTAWVEVEGG